jgi:hypothetical protein
MGKAIGRALMMTIAFLCATVAAIFVFVTLGLERITGALHAASGEDALQPMFDLLNQGLMLTTGLTVIPAILVVLLGELASIRSVLYYIAAGGAALLAVPLLAQLPQVQGGLRTPVVWQVFATAGFAGGFVYWLLAGRNA